MRTVLTDEQRQWLRENYGVLTQTAICKELHLSPHSIRVYAAELGIATQKDLEQMLSIRERTSMWCDTGAEDVCMDCFSYLLGGFCKKKDRYVGALWKKRCFKGI